MIIGKKKSPLKDTGKGRGHAIMTKKQHVNAHDGDVESAGYEEEAKDYLNPTTWQSNITNTTASFLGYTGPDFSKSTIPKKEEEEEESFTYEEEEIEEEQTITHDILGSVVDINDPNLKKGIYFMRKGDEFKKVDFDGIDKSVFDLTEGTFSTTVEEPISEETRLEIKERNADLMKELGFTTITSPLDTEDPTSINFPINYKPIEIDGFGNIISNSDPIEVNKYYNSDEYINTQPVLKEAIEKIATLEDSKYTKQDLINEYRRILSQGGDVNEITINEEYDNDSEVIIKNSDSEELSINNPFSYKVPSFSSNIETNSRLNIVNTHILSGNDVNLWDASINKTKILWNNGVNGQGKVKNFMGVASMSMEDASKHFGIPIDELKFYEFKYNKDAHDYTPIPLFVGEGKAKEDFESTDYEKFPGNEIMHKKQKIKQDKIIGKYNLLLDEINEKVRQGGDRDELQKQWDTIVSQMDKELNEEMSKFINEQFGAFSQEEEYIETLAESQNVKLTEPKYKPHQPGTDRQGRLITAPKYEMSLDLFERDLHYEEEYSSSSRGLLWGENNIQKSIKEYLNNVKLDGFGGEWKVETLRAGRDHVRVTRSDGTYFDIIPNSPFNENMLGTSYMSGLYEDINNGEDYSKDGVDNINANILKAFNKFISEPLDVKGRYIKGDFNLENDHDIALYVRGDNKRFLTEEVRLYDGKGFNAFEQNFGGFGTKQTLTTDGKISFLNEIKLVYTDIYNNPQQFRTNRTWQINKHELPKNSGGYNEEDIEEIETLVWEEMVNKGYKISFEDWQDLIGRSGPAIIQSINNENERTKKDENRISSETASDVQINAYNEVQIKLLVHEEERDLLEIHTENEKLNEDIRMWKGQLNTSYDEYHGGDKNAKALILSGSDEEIKEVKDKIATAKERQNELQLLVEDLHKTLDGKGVEGYADGTSTFDKGGDRINDKTDPKNNFESAYSDWSYQLNSWRKAEGLSMTAKQSELEFYKHLVTEDLNLIKEGKNTFVTFNLSDRLDKFGELDADYWMKDRKGNQKKDRAMMVFSKYKHKIDENGNLKLSLDEINSLTKHANWDMFGIDGFLEHNTSYKFTPEDVNSWYEVGFGISDGDLSTWRAFNEKKKTNKNLRTVGFTQAYLEKDLSNVKAFGDGREWGHLWTGAVRATATTFGFNDDDADNWAAYLSTTDDALDGRQTDAWLLDKANEYSANFNDVFANDIASGDVDALEWNEDQLDAMTRGYWDNQTDMIGGFLPIMAELIGVTYLTGGTAGPAAVARFATRLGASSGWSKFAYHTSAFALEEFKLQTVGFKPMSGGTFYLSHLGVSSIPMPSLLKTASRTIWGVKPALSTLKTGGVMAGTMEIAGITELGYEYIVDGESFKLEMEHLYGDMDVTTQRLLSNALLGKVYGTFKAQESGLDMFGLGKKAWYRPRDIQNAINKIDNKRDKLPSNTEGRQWKDGKLIDSEGNVIESGLSPTERLNLDYVESKRKGAPLTGENRLDIPPRGVDKKQWDLMSIKEKLDYNSYTESKNDLINLGVNSLYNSKLNPENPEVYEKAKLKFEAEVNEKGERKYDDNQVAELARRETVETFKENHKKMIWNPFRNSFREMFGDKAANGMEIKYVDYGPESTPESIAKGRKDAGFEVEGSTAEFKANKDGSGTILIDVNQYTAGKSVHEIFMHATMNGLWNKEALKRGDGTTKEQIQMEFIGMIKNNFKEFNFKTPDGTPLGDRLAEMLGGGETRAKYIQEYIENGKSQKQAEKLADKRIKLEEKEWTQLQNEEFLAYIGEMLTSPKNYYSEVAPTAFREARIDFMDWYRGLTGSPAKIKTTREFIDILGTLGKKVRTGEDFKATYKDLAHNLQLVYRNGREKGKKGDVLVDVPIQVFEYQKLNEAKETKEQAKESRDLNKEVKKVEKVIPEYEKQSSETQDYYKENIESESNNTQRRKNILEFTRVGTFIDTKTGENKSVAGEYWDRIIWAQVDIASKKMKLTDPDKYTLALELVTDRNKQGNQGLRAIIEKYYQRKDFVQDNKFVMFDKKGDKKLTENQIKSLEKEFDAKAGSKEFINQAIAKGYKGKQNITKTVMQQLSLKVIDMVNKMDKTGKFEGGEKGKELSEMVDVGEISESVAAKADYTFQPEIKGKGKGINVFKRLDIDKSHPGAEKLIFERSEKIILETPLKDLEYNLIGRKSTSVVKPIIEREFNFSERIKRALTTKYLKDIDVKDIKQLSRVQKGELNKILLEGPERLIDEKWDVVLAALPNQLNLATGKTSWVLKTWGGNTKNPSPIYTNTGTKYTYAEMSEINKTHDMGWTKEYMASQPPKIEKNENISKEAFLNYIYKKPDGGKLRFEQVETRINSLIDFVTSTVATQKTKDLLNNPAIQESLMIQSEGAMSILMMENTLKRVSQRIKGSLPESLASKDGIVVDNFLKEYKDHWGNKAKLYKGGLSIRDERSVAEWISDKINSNPEYKRVLGKYENAIMKDLKIEIPENVRELQQKIGEVNTALGVTRGKMFVPKVWESGSWKGEGGVNEGLKNFLSKEYIKKHGSDKGLKKYLKGLNIDKTHQERFNNVEFMRDTYLPAAKRLFESMPKEFHQIIAQSVLLNGIYKMKVETADALGIELTSRGYISGKWKDNFIKDIKGSGKPFMVKIDGVERNGAELVKRMDNGTLKFNLLGWRINKKGKKVYKENSKGERVPGIYEKFPGLESGDPKIVKRFSDHVKKYVLKADKAKTYEETVIANEALTELFYTELLNSYKGSENKIDAINSIQFLLQSQTNIGQGVTRALATHTAITTKKELLHSEHEFQVMNFNGNFMTNMVENAGSKKNFTSNLKSTIGIFKQSIITKELQGILDSPANKGKLGFDALVLEGFGAKFNFLKDQSILSTMVDLKTGMTYDALAKTVLRTGKGLEVLNKIREKHATKLDGIIGPRASKNLTTSEMIEKLSTIDNAITEGRKRKKKRKGGSFWDFDDTLATTKSGVRARVPNTDGLPKPNRKVVFLAGGAGSGKGNVIKKLRLEKDGFKIVNQDISLEWLKKNHGLPENMNDLTKEQRSTLGKLGHQARTIAKGKMMKYQGNAEGVVVDGTGGSIKAMEGLVKEFKEKGYDVSMLFVETSLETALQRNKARKERSLLDKMVIKNHEAVQGNKEGFKTMFGKRFMEAKTDKLKQEDAMPENLVNKMNDFVSGYEKIRLDAEQYAAEGKSILDRGGEFDFTEFDIVTKGEKGPFFQKALDRAKKFGTKDQFIITARPPEAQVPIYEFLKSQGLEIPLKNIKGLGNSTSEAKAMYMLEKFAEGYNDIYFADDAMQNVKAVRDVLSKVDVKSKVVQAKSSNEVKDIDRLDSPDVFTNVRASKNLRSEYEKTISKHRPDLVKEKLVSKTVDGMFKFIDELNVPINKKKKYERITTKWIATSNIKLKEDGYKIKEAVDIAERYKEDIFSYNNPNQIIEKYAGKVKEKPTNPRDVKEFSKGKVTNKEHGIVEYEVANTKEGQQAVRKVMDTHFGEKSNPWCLAQKKDGKLTKESWDRWEHYSDGPKSLVFQNGKLIGFKANKQYWDRMDNATDAPVVRIKEGRVTKTVELVPMGKGKVEEFVMETRTTSKDKKTVTTEYNVERSLDPTGFDFHPAGTKIVENKVNGITVRETNYKPNGKTRKITEFESGKEIESRSFMPDGKRTMSINRRLNKNQKLLHGDFVSHEARDGKVDLWFGETLINGKVTEIGFKTPRDFEVMDIMKRVDGKLRVDLNKLRKIDPDVKGLPKEIVKPEGMRTLEPVKKVLDQLDMKSDVQQSRASKDLSKDFNNILEEVKDVKSFKTYSEGKAKQIGAKKGIWKWWGSSGMEDFQGLVTYAFAGKGKKGESHKKFFEDNLQKPYNRAYNEIHSIKQTMSNDYTALRRAMPEVRKILNDKTLVDGVKGVYTVDNAIRAYLWNKAGYEIPGMSKRDLKNLIEAVEGDAPTKAFAESVSAITKLKEGYSKPSEYWLGENITADLQKLADGHYRDIALTEFKENRESIFGKWKGGKLIGDNMNKIEAVYGTKHRENIEGMLWAMETGQNRPYGTDAITNKWMNWINNAGGTIMFFNVKSAALQTISNLNYMNGTFNNPLRAGMAFANLPQYIKDFSKIFNSDMLLQRRSGLKINIEASELTNRLSGKSNKAQRALSYLLEKGFIPTKYADSFAIAMGGATYYRNRIKDLIKRGYSKAEAEKLAWIDFTEITEATQQSSRPDFISAQQRSAVGRPILMFGNTPMQMFRRHKRRVQDIANNRGNMTENILSAAYYGAVQTMIFSYLANAMFAKDEDDLEKEESGFNEKKDTRFYETIVDSYLRGMGIMGAVPAALKNGILEFMTQNEKDHNADYNEVVFDLLNVSPPIGSKVRKLVSAGKTWKFNKDEVKEMGFDIDNPIIGATANVISALTNVPLDRVVLKLQNLRDASNNDYKTWERIALGTGVNRWALGLGKQEAVIEAETKVKEKKKIETEIKREEKKKIKLKEKYPNKNDEEIEIIVKSKELFDLSKQEQVDLLKSLDLSDKEIKKLKKEKERTDKIAELYKDNSKLIDDALETSRTKPREEKVKKKEVKLSKSEKYKKSLFKMNKKDQVNLLLEYGLSPRRIQQLKYEKDRVEMIIKLESKKSK